MASKIKVGGGTRALQESEAIPESKVHADPQPPAYDWSLFTINGQPIPVELWPNMNYHLTDQAKAERDEKRGPKPSVEVVRDQADKKLDTFRDGLKSGHLIDQQDPLDYVMKKFVPPGMSGLWIGPRRSKDHGLVRGRIEYKPLMVDEALVHPEQYPDGKMSGKLVRVEQNSMFLAVVPIEAKRENDRFYASLSDQEQADVAAVVTEQVEKIGYDTGAFNRLARKKGQNREGLLGDLEVEDQETGDEELAKVLTEQLAHESV